MPLSVLVICFGKAYIVSIRFKVSCLIILSLWLPNLVITLVIGFKGSVIPEDNIMNAFHTNF